MTDRLKNQLDAIFDAHNSAKQKAQQQKSQRETREEEFIQSFTLAQKTVIQPTYERVGEYIKGQGYDYRIEENQESTYQDDRYQPPSIVIRFLFPEPSSRYRDYDHPHFSTICERSQAKVRFHQCTMTPGRGGMSGTVGEATLAEITPDLIESKLVTLLRDVFK